MICILQNTKDNPQFLPLHLKADELEANARKLNELRQLVLMAKEFHRAVSDVFMQHSDFCYHDAMLIYNGLKALFKSKKQGAQFFYETLKKYFDRRRKSAALPDGEGLAADLSDAVKTE